MDAIELHKVICFEKPELLHTFFCKVFSQSRSVVEEPRFVEADLCVV